MRSARRAREAFGVVVAQTRPVFGEVERNVTQALRLVERALAGRRADLVVLPELFHTGYVFRSRAEARALAEDPRRGPTARALRAFAELVAADGDEALAKSARAEAELLCEDS